MKSAVVAAVTSVALSTAGCAARSDAVGGTAPTPTAGADARLVLRTRTVGGIAGLGRPGSLPDVSVYRDGRAITGARTEYRLTPKALRRLLAAADEAGLATARTAESRPGTTDTLYKIITFVAGGRARTSVIADPGGDQRVLSFFTRLDPARWPRADLAADPRPYRPVRAVALAAPTEATGPAWPLRPLSAGTRVGGRTCTLLTGEEVTRAERLTARTAVWRDQGRSYQVTVRPLLPDEATCTALA